MAIYTSYYTPTKGMREHAVSKVHNFKMKLCVNLHKIKAISRCCEETFKQEDSESIWVHGQEEKKTTEPTYSMLMHNKHRKTNLNISKIA